MTVKLHCSSAHHPDFHHFRKPSSCIVSCRMQVLPNQDKKAAIVNYKEKTVEEIVSVAASVPPGHASKLLQRAESFIRPHLPDRSAQTKLLKILQLRAGLPAVLRGEAVRELVNIVSGRQEDEVSRDLLSHFEDWGVGLHLATVSDEVLTRFQALARKPPMLACHEARLLRGIVSRSVFGVHRKLSPQLNRCCSWWIYS